MSFRRLISSAGFRAANISMTEGRVCLYKSGTATVTVICVINVEKDAPVAPYRGIMSAFRIKLMMTPKRAKRPEYFWSPSHKS